MSKIGITIGNFDGVHIGHQKVLRHLKEKNEKAIVLTFSNHPSEILHTKPKPLLTTKTHKLSLLNDLDMEVWTVPFTKGFAEQPAEVFLSRLKKRCNFSCLILGHDALIGKNREGDISLLRSLSSQLHFDLEYVPPVMLENEAISSSQIRRLILKGDFEAARSLLGRPYSIQGEVIAGAGKGKEIGFPTANIDVSMLCLPPFGVYSVLVNGLRGIANLGLAPTLHKERHPHLEVHIFDLQRELYGTLLDVTFLHFIREERHFDSQGALKRQIEQDINCVKTGSHLHL